MTSTSDRLDAKKAIVFLGPTLPLALARRYLDAVFLPPAAQGDVLRALSHDPPAIVVIDGYFSSVPAVWHKEILLAMARGVYVFGASSMGALRAAELHRFGMIGVGQVFDWFQDGVLEDDDEVAIVHGPAAAGFVPLSDAMVDIRHALGRAVEAEVVPKGLADRLVAMAKAMHYPERSFSRLLADARAAGEDSATLDAFEATRAAAGHSVKQSDAIAVLRTVGRHLASNPSPLLVPWTLEHTVFLQNTRMEIKLATLPGGVASEAEDVDGIDADPFGPDRLQLLLRLLAREIADVRRLDVSGLELHAAVNKLRRSLGLLKAADTRRWLRTAGLRLADLQELARDEELIGKLASLHRDEIAAGLAGHIYLHSPYES